MKQDLINIKSKHFRHFIHSGDSIILYLIETVDKVLEKQKINKVISNLTIQKKAKDMKLK